MLRSNLFRKLSWSIAIVAIAAGLVPLFSCGTNPPPAVIPPAVATAPVVNPGYPGGYPGTYPGGYPPAGSSVGYGAIPGYNNGFQLWWYANQQQYANYNYWVYACYNGVTNNCQPYVNFICSGWGSCVPYYNGVPLTLNTQYAFGANNSYLYFNFYSQAMPSNLTFQIMPYTGTWYGPSYAGANWYAYFSTGGGFRWW